MRMLLLAALLPLAGVASAAPPAVAGLRLYAANCGEIAFENLSFFSDTGDYDGRPGRLVVPCYVIRHPKGTLLWDAGLGDSYVGKPGTLGPGVTVKVATSLVDELKAIGLAPADFSYVAFSHLHADHTGNANLFPAATWILNQTELAAAINVPPPFGVNAATFSGYAQAKQQLIDGDYDVFGDGTVRILRAPGHTPGHQVLVLKFRKAGNVILSGDLYHLRDSVANHRMPVINVSRADTLASMERVDRLVANLKARLVVEHDLGDFNSLPRFPAYLD
ncbi:MAG TPA: N-acyl homoserine lactonase family protein [Steroidobacteraceae bacterium]|nr:N-acyl homoserine lactonase family protein [Steroidobacteraceae bacterium]